MQREIPEEVNITACKLAKSLGVKTILDMGGADTTLSKELLSYLSIISPNKTELKRILHREISVDNQEELLAAVNEMRTISNNPELCVLLKLGSKGCEFIDQNNKIYSQKAFNLEDMPIVDTTGAGDCFTAALATQLIDDKSIEEALKFATASAYICITRCGAMPSTPKREEVEALLKRLEK